jgi:hypothetical protein
VAVVLVVLVEVQQQAEVLETIPYLVLLLL